MEVQMSEELQKNQVIDDDDLFLADDDDENTMENKYLLFNLGKEVYGIGIAFVRDIIELQPITNVPDMPNYVKGVINLRGNVIPVIDLRLRFGLEAREYDDRTCIIIVNNESMSTGLIVDTVAEVDEIPRSDVDEPPKFKSNTGKERYISGLGKVNDEVKILLNVEKILTDENLEEIGNTEPNPDTEKVQA
jgi:purine-binding chemotaxis protein CheW